MTTVQTEINPIRDIPLSNGKRITLQRVSGGNKRVKINVVEPYINEKQQQIAIEFSKDIVEQVNKNDNLERRIRQLEINIGILMDDALQRQNDEKILRLSSCLNKVRISLIHQFGEYKLDDDAILTFNKKLMKESHSNNPKPLTNLLFETYQITVGTWYDLNNKLSLSRNTITHPPLGVNFVPEIGNRVELLLFVNNNEKLAWASDAFTNILRYLP